ncbi:glycerate kinase [Bacillus luteolus]|uniref:Glycerate kinase n=1 Tax=Litchfieldia luteola TaxID=682179 RepID=A0ABR9QGK3_9BACI|nr:glycerate kinase [Cytobacillus luteolus]MBE4907622.1 glycerate kinase [Cytobacillus luteolus]MBP1941073.1 glycerate kinase [Cytobacillus luteolus]
MKIVIAPDSFKGSLSAIEVCQFMKEGVLQAIPHANVTEMPMADGGEGTLECLINGTNGTFFEEVVKGPLGQPVQAKWGILGGGSKTAVIEMAQASGLTLISKKERNPRRTNTYGTGQLIKCALDKGCTRIIIGLGGSATNDGGMGMAAALGVRFYNKNGESLPLGGITLAELDVVDVDELDPRVKNLEFIIASDVTNPLCGPTGASTIFGPQKGASSKDAKELDDALRNFAEKVHESVGKDILHIPGSGAAGGLGGGLIAFLNAKVSSGIEIIMNTLGFEEYIKDADLVLTGEGRTDEQTIYGKVPVGVARVAKKYNVPAICISGSLGEGTDQLYEQGITAVFSIIDAPNSLEEIFSKTGSLLKSATSNVIRLVGLNERDR